MRLSSRRSTSPSRNGGMEMHRRAVRHKRRMVPLRSRLPLQIRCPFQPWFPRNLECLKEANVAFSTRLRKYATVTEPRHPRRSLEAEVIRDLGKPTDGAAVLVARAALGLAETDRFGAINSGRVGRTDLLALLVWSRRVLDADLEAPATWRGPSRRALAAGGRENSPWLGPAFAEAATAPDDIRAEDLLRWNRTVGAPGEWRTRAMRVGGFRVRFSPEQSLALVPQLLARANRRDEPAPLAATRLHVGLLLCHPFRDGNGRTARLAAAAVLLRDGTRTSLQTCVEQHHHLAPARYSGLMGRLRQGSLRADQVIDGFLGAMAGRCVLASWVHHRQEILLEAARSLDHEDPVTAVRCFEFGDCVSPLSTHGGQPMEPWCRLRPHLHTLIARELRSQLARSVGDAIHSGRLR